MDDPFLVGMLNGLAGRHEQLQTLLGRKFVAITVLVDRDPLYQLHHEIRQTLFGGASVENLGDVGVIHHCQRLPLGLETRDNFSIVCSALDQLQRNSAANGVLLLGHPDRSHATFA